MDEVGEAKIAGFNFWLDFTETYFCPGNIQCYRL